MLIFTNWLHKKITCNMVKIVFNYYQLWIFLKKSMKMLLNYIELLDLSVLGRCPLMSLRSGRSDRLLIFFNNFLVWFSLCLLGLCLAKLEICWFDCTWYLVAWCDYNVTIYRTLTFWNCCLGIKLQYLIKVMNNK